MFTCYDYIEYVVYLIKKQLKTIAETFLSCSLYVVTNSHCFSFIYDNRHWCFVEILYNIYLTGVRNKKVRLPKKS